MGPALQGSLQYCGRTGASAPTVLRNEEVRRGGALPLPRAGKSAKRRRWRMQRAGFEEVPRLADTTVAGNRLARRWAREPRPYGSVTRSVTSIGRADVGIGPYGENLGRTKGKSKRIPEYPLAFDRSEELEVLDDVNDFSTDALLSLQGGRADMSGRLENVPVAHF